MAVEQPNTRYPLLHTGESLGRSARITAVIWDAITTSEAASLKDEAGNTFWNRTSATGDKSIFDFLGGLLVGDVTATIAHGTIRLILE